ncbi:polysaccharide biosynthesis protein [Sphingomonas xanthus]|uniref:Polysaccharide biosynthesis protein n=1 Tax=Sphingomonas xanthus TaxID=2594473 RepID=A0A516IUB3_9SPHN|nr:nucleoside-diphosphate sugar epimerase/dehydratase [Sphingomonas xanthus]QDP20449.1 polysaccharide biosynthesis protein [Sphingomonas xanthus]
MSEKEGVSVLYAYLPDLVALPRPVRRLMIVGADLAACAIAVWIAFWLRLGEWDWINGPLLQFMALAMATWLLVALPFGTYRSVVRFSGRHTVFRLIPVFAIVSVSLAAILFSLKPPGIPRTLSVLHPLVFFFGAATLRVTAAQLIWNAVQARSRRPNQRRVLIYGAGSAGRQLAQSMRLEPGLDLIGFLDCNESLGNRVLEGKKIWHSSELERVLIVEDITDVYIAMPSVRRQTKREIIDSIYKATSHIRVMALPSLSQIAFGNVSTSDLKEIQIEELLGRDEVAAEPELLARDVHGQVVMVTGAGGSIGSELARQILRQLPRQLILADQSEFFLYKIDTELRELAARENLEISIVADLADVADELDCTRLFDRWSPRTVFHAAAYKHVPLVEANRLAGIRNNVIGTLNAALNAERVGSEKFVLISTDKAVRPTNIMGASKRACELVIQARAAAQTDTIFTAVRFGNVLGSSGSVVPRFREQIARGGPITLTDFNVTRYFMTIPEAAQLVIQAGAMAHGGEIFLLDMGQPVKIADLAKAMVELSGLTVRDEKNPDGDIELVEVGLRPGEKLYEELLIDASAEPTCHPRIVRAREQHLAWMHLEEQFDLLKQHIDALDEPRTVTKILDMVPGYTPASHAQVHTAEDGGMSGTIAA